MLIIKSSPEEFVVREVAKLQLQSEGPYAYFLLKKKNLTTQEAVEKLAKALKIHPSRIGIAGLKDKVSVSYQHVSVKGLKSPKDLKGEGWEAKFLGFGNDPVVAGSLEGNEFEVIVRGITKRHLAILERSQEWVRSLGFENYFGKQRFGSVKHSGEFITPFLLREDFEGALKSYLTSVADKRLRKRLLSLWGNWKAFLKAMPEGGVHERNVVKALASGKSFKEAFNALPRRIRLILIFAYQSYLWNTFLSRFVMRYLPHVRVPFLRWSLAFSTEVNPKIVEEIKDLEIPYLGMEYSAPTKVKLIIQEVLREEGLREKDLKKEVGGLSLFTDGIRRAFVKVEDLEIEKLSGRSLKLKFFLPAGSYATIFLSKLFLEEVMERRL